DAMKRHNVSAEVDRTDRLAILGGFIEIDRGMPHGTNHAGSLATRALASPGRYKEIHSYHDPVHTLWRHRERSRFCPPGTPNFAALERSTLALHAHRYGIIYASAGDQMQHMPHACRPVDDWVPVVCDIDCSHNPSQWVHLFIAGLTGYLRESD